MDRTLPKNSDNVPSSEKLQKQFHDLYEKRLMALACTESRDSLEKQNLLLKRWVGDLEAQNHLLVKSVRDMEVENVNRAKAMAKEIKKRIERESAEKIESLKVLSDSLQKEIKAKESEISRLAQRIEDNERKASERATSINDPIALMPPSRDAEVNVSLCCSSFEREPVKDSTISFEDIKKMKEEMKILEIKLKEAIESERIIKCTNSQMCEDMATLRGVCVALKEQCHTCELNTQFKDDIIREMRRQLKQAKAKLKEESISINIQKQTIQDISSGDYTLNKFDCKPKNSLSSSLPQASSSAKNIKCKEFEFLDRGDNVNIKSKRYTLNGGGDTQ